MNTIIDSYTPLGSQDLQRNNNTTFGTGQPGNAPTPETTIFEYQDKVSLRYSAESSVTYTSSMTMNTAGLGDKFKLLQELVANMLKEQGVELTVPTGTGEINIDQISQEEAQELVSEDGYFGVAQTSERIVDFAIAISGGDSSRLDAIKEGIDKGFQEAKEAFGGWLPEISFDTYDAVMEKLDAWAESENTNYVA